MPIVICPWGELPALLSVRHFTTMDVEDMDTYATVKVQSFVQCKLAALTPMSRKQFASFFLQSLFLITVIVLQE